MTTELPAVTPQPPPQSEVEHSSFKARRTWTALEDQTLKELVSQFGETRGSHWKQIASGLPSRTAKDCRKRWFHSLDPSLRKGRWTEHEDRILLESYALLGPAWHDIALLIPGRKDNQCSKRYSDILNPAAKNRLRGWTEEEDLILTDSVRTLGHRWAAISGRLINRPALTCRNRWRNLSRRAGEINQVNLGGSPSYISAMQESDTSVSPGDQVTTSPSTNHETAHMSEDFSLSDADPFLSQIYMDEFQSPGTPGNSDTQLLEAPGTFHGLLPMAPQWDNTTLQDVPDAQGTQNLGHARSKSNTFGAKSDNRSLLGSQTTGQHSSFNQAPVESRSSRPTQQPPYTSARDSGLNYREIELVSEKGFRRLNLHQNPFDEMQQQVPQPQQHHHHHHYHVHHHHYHYNHSAI